MNDVIEQLANLNSTSHGITPDDVVRGDLLRGRAALRRRRTRRAITGLAAVAAVAAFAVGAAAIGPDASHQPAPAGLDLVSYTGAQLPGFNVGKVPEGFGLQGADGHGLRLVPYGLAVVTDDPSTHAFDDYSGKIAVSLRSGQLAGSRDGERVVINHRPGFIVKNDPTVTRIYYTDETGQGILVEADNTLGLSNAELVALAASVNTLRRPDAG